MSQKTFCSVAAIVFLAVTVLHLLRVILGWDLVIGGWMAPKWASYVFLPVGAFLSYTGFSLARKP